MATDASAGEVFAVNFAALAREIAMDIFELDQILQIHQLSVEEWERIQKNQQFQQMLRGLIGEWQSAANTRERVRIKAATGIEMHLEELITSLGDEAIPLGQRVEAAKFLARLGELDNTREFAAGGAFQINLNIGNQLVSKTPVIEHDAVEVVK